MKNGSVYQRHLKQCPRDPAGNVLAHRCRGTWAYQVDLGRRLDGTRVQATTSGFTTKLEARAALKEIVRQASATDIDRSTSPSQTTWSSGWPASGRCGRRRSRRTGATSTSTSCRSSAG